MPTIWKFPLKVEDRQIINMPAGAQILTVQVQDELLTLWALVSHNVPVVPRTIDIYGTGHPIPTNGNPRRYIGSCQMLMGRLIFHVFEII